MHSILLKTIVISVVLAAALGLAQMWFALLNAAIFFKVMITLGVVILITAFLLVVGIDFGSTKKLKDENYLD